ncbi:MAG: hypothetical protein OEM82_12270 [Acidobacteriota bacterium]|nr:hypothetical protein [Acidobacteriota bacterium]MDH3531100.1 hypothetical protein [Acidobacteriota bacterium]
MRGVFLTAVLFFAAHLCVSEVPAHEFHTTFTTIEHNIPEKNIEITIRVFTHDLSPTLEKRLGRKIDLGREEIDSAVMSYVREKFEIRTKIGEVLIPQWVGKEVDAQVAYFYLEIPFEGELAGAAVLNGMFFESFEEQVNYVSVSAGDLKRGFVFKVGDKAKEVSSDK